MNDVWKRTVVWRETRWESWEEFDAAPRYRGGRLGRGSNEVNSEAGTWEEGVTLGHAKSRKWQLPPAVPSKPAAWKIGKAQKMKCGPSRSVLAR
jgi:hypothetical protein